MEPQASNWAVYPANGNGEIHIIPTKDILRHWHSKACECSPAWDGFLVIHELFLGHMEVYNEV